MTVKLNVSGMIVNSDDAPIYRDYFGVDTTAPKDFADALDTAGNEDVEVAINSYGGEVPAAAEIFTKLKNYPGKVTTKIESSAYSAASVIAMAGDVVQISPVAQIMVHDASNGAEGNKHDMDKAAQMLSATDRSIANAYATKTGRPLDEFLALMDKETWITAQDAQALGMVDEIMDFNITPVTNAVGNLIPHNAIQKIKQLRAENNANNSQLPAHDELTQKKLAIFFGKKEE
jgi:ATP-dependent Clp protease protease subunit